MASCIRQIILVSSIFLVLWTPSLAQDPTFIPTNHPTFHPTDVPTANPSGDPTVSPSTDPTTGPTADPTSEFDHQSTVMDIGTSELDTSSEDEDDGKQSIKGGTIAVIVLGIPLCCAISFCLFYMAGCCAWLSIGKREKKRKYSSVEAGGF